MGAKWEYKVDSFEPIPRGHTGKLQDYLNKLGDEGWELASLVGHETVQTLFFTVVIKRPKK
jgi:hypothetical protein